MTPWVEGTPFKDTNETRLSLTEPYPVLTLQLLLRHLTGVMREPMAWSVAKLVIPPTERTWEVKNAGLREPS